MARPKSLSRQVIEPLKQPGLESISPEPLAPIRSGLQDPLERRDQEAAFQRRGGEKMPGGPRNVHREIGEISGGGRVRTPGGAEEAGAVFREASRQLDEIMTTTLNAAGSIMDLAEEIQDGQKSILRTLEDLRASGRLDAAAFAALAEAERRNAAAVSSIVTALSFQDLTGQRIKKVATVLGSVRDIVVEARISAGLMLKETEAEPEKDVAASEREGRVPAGAARRGSELKGPTLDGNQKDVDDLLARLGL